MKACKNVFKMLFGIIALISLLCVLVSCGGTDCTHEGGTATCTEKAKCALCGTSYGELDPTCHSSGDFTYVINTADNTKHDKKHACCGALVETVVHTWGEGVETEPPTDDDDGLMTYTCQLCPAIREETIPSLSHTHAPTHTAATEPDCDTDGNIEYWDCEGCDKYFSDADCTDMILRDATVIPASHSLVSTSTTATCTESGKTVYDCENCDYALTVETTPALGHTVSVLNVKSITKVDGESCKYDVLYSGSCSKCGDSAEETVRETRHTYTASIKTDATCQSAGVKVYTCVNGCQGASYEGGYSDPYAHTWVVDGAPIGECQPYKCNNNGCTEHKSVVVLADGKIDKSDILANELKVGNVSLTLDFTLVSKLSDGEVAIGAEALSGDSKAAVLNKLSSAEQTALNGKNIYDFTLMQGSTVISDFDGGKAKITVPYTLASGEDPDCIVVWFIADDGKVTVKEAEYWGGFVTFEATHFSNYAFTSANPDEACLANGHNYVAQEGGRVEATCDTIGYTTKICTRCKDTYVADVVYELGHKFTAAPTVVAPTCDKYGRYVYTCQVSGCGHVQEVPIKPTHDYKFYDEKSATCCEDGYYRLKCSVCQDIKTTVYEKDPFLHQCKNEYELVDGGTSCSDGVIEYRRCQVSGCDYEEVSRTFAYHEEVKVYDDEGNYIEPEWVTVDLADYIDLTSLGYPSDGTLEIRARKTACVCENVYSCVEVFDSNGSYSRSFDSYYEGSEQIELTNGMPAEWGGFSIIIYFRTVAEGGDSPCYEKKTLEVLIDYDAATDTAENTLSFTLSDGYNHKNTYNTYLLAPGSELCEDGLICTWNCRDCDTEIDRWNDGLLGSNQHRYNDIYPTYDLSRYSDSGHKTYIIERRCACGMSKLEVKTGSTSATKCVFKSETTTNSNGIVTTIYTCDCGIIYRQDTSNNVKVNDCTYRSSQKIYYNYDEETEVFMSATVSTHIDSFSHSYKNHKEYTYTNGCYVEYVATLRCDCGALYPNYEQSYSRYQHEVESTFTLDSMHNATVYYSCESCNWNAVAIDDEDGTRHYFYEEIYNTQTGVKTVETSVYKYFWGTPNRILYKQEFYDISTGELISWVHTASIYTLGTDRGCYEVRCITSSDGELEVEELCICNTWDYIYKEPTCTQFGEEGYLCTDCGNGAIRELYPNGHWWMYNDENSFICDACGVTSDSDKMCAVELEILENDDGFVIGYHNRNAGIDFGRVDGTVKLEVVTANATLEANVTYTDDGKSTFTVTVSDINTALAALDLPEGAEYEVWLSVDSGMYDGSVTRIVLFSSAN